MTLVVVHDPQLRGARAEQLDRGVDHALEHLVERQRGGQRVGQARERLEPAALLATLGQEGGAGDRLSHLMRDRLE